MRTLFLKCGTGPESDCAEKHNRDKATLTATWRDVRKLERQSEERAENLELSETKFIASMLYDSPAEKITEQMFITEN